MVHATATSFARLRLATTAAAIACLAGAIVVPTSDWAGWFAHPAVETSISHHGASWWRVMLVVAAAGLVTAPSLLIALARRGDHHDPAHGASWAIAPVSTAERWVMPGLVGLALAVRCPRLGESLWYDEIASWMTYNAGVDGWGSVVGSFLDPINHVMHTLLNRWSTADSLVSLLGMEAAFRLPSLLFSLASVPIMFGLGRAAAGTRTGQLAAALTAIAPVCVLEAAEARGYSQMIAFSALSTWLFIAAWRRSDRPQLWVFYAIACALGAWSQFVTAWLAIGHGAWLTVRYVGHREDRRQCAAGFTALALGGLLALTLYAPMIPGMLAWQNNFFSDRGDEPRILGPEGLHALLQLGGSWTWWAAMPGLLMFAAGLVAAGLCRTPRVPGACTPANTLMLALLGLPLMILVVALSGSWLYARFTLFAFPGAVLGMALGIDALWRLRRRTGALALGVIATGWMLDLFARPPKQPLREAMEYIAQHMQQGDRAVEIGVAHPVAQIYRPNGLSMALSSFHGRGLAGQLQQPLPRWVIVEYPRKVDDMTYALLNDRGYSLAREFRGWADWVHGDVLVYERSAAGQQSRED